MSALRLTRAARNRERTVSTLLSGSPSPRTVLASSSQALRRSVTFAWNDSDFASVVK